jgi:hypothetical protein
MTYTPETHYARSADGTNLAYQVSGDGPLEVLYHNAGGFPFDLLSEDPGFVRVVGGWTASAAPSGRMPEAWAHPRAILGTP